MMKTSDDIIDGFDGLLTKEQADRLYSESKAHPATKEETVTARYINTLMEPGATGILKGLEKEKLDIKDEIYRIFNPVKKNFNNSITVSRILVLGKEGSTVNVLLNGKISDIIDAGYFLRGDTIIITKLTLDIRKSLLRSTQKTSIKRITAASNNIKDLSLLIPGMKNINIAGVAIEAGPIKITQASSAKKLASTYLILSNAKTSVRVVCTGSSAETASKLPLNSKVRIEFCDVSSNKGATEVHAGDLSRIAVLSK
ncbi:MAG: hypothetical protein QXR73_02220 [Candidatus Micrarchaeaceae archaeon]